MALQLNQRGNQTDQLHIYSYARAHLVLLICNLLDKYYPRSLYMSVVLQFSYLPFRCSSPECAVDSMDNVRLNFIPLEMVSNVLGSSIKEMVG